MANKPKFVRKAEKAGEALARSGKGANAKPSEIKGGAKVAKAAANSSPKKSMQITDALNKGFSGGGKNSQPTAVGAKKAAANKPK